MAEGGTLAWKRQVIDQSRGPVGTYDSMRLPSELPEGVMWQHNPDNREWTLVRLDRPQQQRQGGQQQQKYQLQRTMAWNPHTGREQWCVRLKAVQQVAGTKDSNNKTLDSDEETIATAVDSVITGTTTTGNDLDYFMDDDDNIDNNNNNVMLNVTPRSMPEPPVLGKDYVVHTVLSSDTFQGILLRYKIKAIELRRINQFSGTNLALAPSHLVIPLTVGRSLDNIRLQDTTSMEYKLQIILTEYPHLTATERKAYLEMNDWDVDAALTEIRNDMQWEEDQDTIQAVQQSIEEVKIPTASRVWDDDDTSSLATPLLTSTNRQQPFELEDL
ncbi:hypothetical protein IV203_007781 [Nitzschia inconspicua]|uniref:LysM domain-containing protein n=1 Tax=Nitzschia inconspicua TaxID=303405 RepID=A0A9K3PLI9_9STRA|nr:hypothetical protein IV203_007781 [Nitzschia inconspicua]